MTTREQNVLMWALKLVNGANWVTLDTETTGLKEPHVIEWAVCDSKLKIVSGRVKPLKPIEAGAVKAHGIRDEDVAMADSFTSVWPTIESAIGSKDVIIYNEPYDRSVLVCSAKAYGMKPSIIFAQNATHCAMRQFAAYRGIMGNYGDYKWAKLEEAAAYLKIKIEGRAHSAGSDAHTTAKIVLKLAEIAEQKLPQNLKDQCLVPVSAPVVES